MEKSILKENDQDFIFVKKHRAITTTVATWRQGTVVNI